MKEIQNTETVVPIDTPPVIGSIHSIPLSAIHPMPNNPFQIRDDPAMNELIESVSQFGILVPVEVRPTEFGDYEMISGSRRQHSYFERMILKCIRQHNRNIPDSLFCLIFNFHDCLFTVSLTDKRASKA